MNDFSRRQKTLLISLKELDCLVLLFCIFETNQEVARNWEVEEGWEVSINIMKDYFLTIELRKKFSDNLLENVIRLDIKTFLVELFLAKMQTQEIFLLLPLSCLSW